MMQGSDASPALFYANWNEFGCVTLIPYVTRAQHLGKFELHMMAIVWASLTLKVIRRRFQNPSWVQQVSVTRELG